MSYTNRSNYLKATQFIPHSLRNTRMLLCLSIPPITLPFNNFLPLLVMFLLLLSIACDGSVLFFDLSLFSTKGGLKTYDNHPSNQFHFSSESSKWPQKTFNKLGWTIVISRRIRLGEEDISIKDTYIFISQPYTSHGPISLQMFAKFGMYNCKSSRYFVNNGGRTIMKISPRPQKQLPAQIQKATKFGLISSIKE